MIESKPEVNEGALLRTTNWNPIEGSHIYHMEHAASLTVY